MHAVKITQSNRQHIRVAGWGLLFGGADLDGERFTPQTDFHLDLVPRKPVYYDHRIEAVKHPLGEVLKVELREAGLWVEAQIERARDYAAEVIALLERGLLGWSSGTAGHLTDREGPLIKRWPILEFSLTPTPAEPRTLGVHVLKSLARSVPELNSLNVEKAQPSPNAMRSLASARLITDQLTPEPLLTKQPITDQLTPKPLLTKQLFTNHLNTEKTMTDTSYTQTQLESAALTAAQEALSLAQDDLEARVAREVKAQVGDPALKEAPFLQAPAFNRAARGDSETKAFAHYVRSGDAGGLRGLKASNDTDMNITTDADGGYAVPTGHFQGIIARRDESMLAPRLGVRLIPGQGTTVNVPVDDEADGEFVSTAEAAAFDRDAPALNQKAMTLVKYTKKVELSVELLQDEDARLMAFLDDFIGRGMAKTHNNLLIGAVDSSGTSFKTFASTTEIAAGEPEDIVGFGELGGYIEDDRSVAWVMRNSTYWDIASITGNARMYAANLDDQGARTLLGYPVFMSQKAGDTELSAKSVYFGNWNYVGLREAPGFTFLRDPYSKASTGQVVLHYFFRAVYAVLQAEAVGYGEHPAV